VDAAAAVTVEDEEEQDVVEAAFEAALGVDFEVVSVAIAVAEEEVEGVQEVVVDEELLEGEEALVVEEEDTEESPKAPEVVRKSSLNPIAMAVYSSLEVEKKIHL